MIRNLKALGLALVAVFAMSAVAASGAQADTVAHFEIGANTVRLDSLADSAHQVYVLGSKTVTCTTVTGHVDPVTPNTKPTDVTATGVAYHNCHTTSLGLSFPTTVTPTLESEGKCHYDFTAGTWLTASKHATGSVHVCATTIDVYNASGGHTVPNMRCQIHVPAQEVKGVTYTNATKDGKMAVTIDVNKAKVTSTVTDFNTLGCNDHEHGDAEYTGNIWVTGTTAAKAASDVTVMGT